MATNDWKSELKRRIKDIRDRKEQEQEVESRTKKYSKPAATEARTVPFPAQPEPESVVEAEQLVSEPPGEEPQPAEPVAEAPVEEEVVKPAAVDDPAPVEEVVAAPAPAEEAVDPAEDFEPESLLEGSEEKPVEPETETTEEEDAIFQIDDSEEERPAVKHDEEAIRAELARLSGGRKKTRAKKEEPTLFPVEEQKKPAAEARIRMEAPAVTDVPEKTMAQKPEPAPVVEKPGKKAAATAEIPSPSNPDCLDEAIDQYIPADPVEGSGKAESAAKPQRPAATVVDKTVRNMCIKRCGAAVFDIFLMLGVVGAVLWISGMIVQGSPLRLLTDSLLPFGAFAVMLHFLYYVIFTATTGQTLGKAVFALRVVKNSSGTIGLGQAALRWLIGLAGTAPALIGYLMMFVTRDGTALQDIALQQRVRRTKKKA